MTTYEIQVRQVPTRTVAALRRHVPMAEIGPAIAAGLGRVYEAVGSEGVAPSGAPFTVYHEVTPEKVDMEICVPVAGEFTSQGEVEAETVPGGAVATTVHRGRYDTIPAAYEALTEWVHAHDAEIAGPAREIFLNEPKEGVDPETEIEFPIG
jgi:effector-binding domain-containing protein